jgi:hypothetical protein
VTLTAVPSEAAAEQRCANRDVEFQAASPLAREALLCEIARVRRAGYARCRWLVGEILAWGVGPRSSAAGTVRAWMDSPPHRRILVSRRYRELGLGMQAGAPIEGLQRGVTVAAVLGRRIC